MGKPLTRASLLLGVGGIRCATTSIAAHLETWDGMACSRNKELGLLQGEDWSPTDVEDRRSDYLSHFPLNGSTRTLFDATTSALYDSTVTLGNARKIAEQVYAFVVLRHPLDRALSAFNYFSKSGREPLDSFACAVREDLSGKRAGWHPSLRYASASDYVPSVNTFVEVLGSENVEIIRFANVISQPQPTLTRVANLIGLEPSSVAFQHYNSSHTASPLGQHKLVKSVSSLLPRRSVEAVKSGVALVTARSKEQHAADPSEIPADIAHYFSELEDRVKSELGIGFALDEERGGDT